MVKFIFFDTNKSLIDSYKNIIKWIKLDISFINIDVQTLLTKHKIDIIVSPANSFGDMKGGIDNAYRNIFDDIEKVVIDSINKAQLAKCKRGYYVPVGQNILVRTGNKSCSHMIVAPTMFTPRNIVGTLNIYLMFYGILQKYNSMNITIACPGLGTGIGGLFSEMSAKQILLAIQDFQNNNPI